MPPARSRMLLQNTEKFERSHPFRSLALSRSACGNHVPMATHCFAHSAITLSYRLCADGFEMIRCIHSHLHGAEMDLAGGCIIFVYFETKHLNDPCSAHIWDWVSGSTWAGGISSFRKVVRPHRWIHSACCTQRHLVCRQARSQPYLVKLQALHVKSYGIIVLL